MPNIDWAAGDNDAGKLATKHWFSVGHVCCPPMMKSFITQVVPLKAQYGAGASIFIEIVEVFFPIIEPVAVTT
jgi:hypothetical protein